MAKFKPMNADALKAPIRRPWCSDTKPMTPERIFAIAKQKGEFMVSWQYRNDNLRKACRKMVAAGLLRCVSSNRGADVFEAVVLPADSGAAP